MEFSSGGCLEMKIGLFGFTFAHENMGCQALTCAFLGILSRLFPEKRIRVIDFHEENSLGLIPGIFPDFEFELYYNGIVI